MAQEGQSETSQHTASSDEDKGTGTQASPSVIEIHDSMTECEEEATPSPVQMEEKAFISRLHAFMKDRGTPIERIPHLGFKQINLWRIYKAVEKLGGMTRQVTARRLWKKVYDELGGESRQHQRCYLHSQTLREMCLGRLVLPFERHLKGEDDRPLPPSKPRKPYKRNLDAKVTKAERKRKRTPSDMDVDSEMEILSQRSPESACPSDAAMHPHPALWAAPSDRLPPKALSQTEPPPPPCARPSTPTSSRSLRPVLGPLMFRLLPERSFLLWRKRSEWLRRALTCPPSPQSEDKERPSVIHCSPSPARASSSQHCNSSDSSPLPSSPSSSRSPSPYSVSSEDGPEETKDKPASDSEISQKCSSSGKNTSSSEERKFASCSQKSKDPAGQNKNVRSQSADSIKIQIEGSAWMPIHKGSVKYAPHPIHLPSSLAVRSDWAPTSTSSFTKVVPKSVQLLRPAPIRPAYKTPQRRLMQQDDSLACAKKLTNMAPWLYQTEKREKSRTVQQKVPSTQQQSLAHSAANLPAPCVHQSCDKSGRDSRHQPLLHPSFLPNRMRLPQSQLTYRHVPMSPAHSALIGSAVYPYPYSIPLLNPQTCYTLPAMHPVYFHKL